MDLVPLIDDKARWDWLLYHWLAPVVRAAARAEKVPLEWGGDWKSFPDAPHWQLPRKKPYLAYGDTRMFTSIDKALVAAIISGRS